MINADTIQQSLTPVQVEELHDDIEKYLRLEQSEINIEFWTVSFVFELSVKTRQHFFPTAYDGCRERCVGPYPNK